MSILKKNFKVVLTAATILGLVSACGGADDKGVASVEAKASQPQVKELSIAASATPHAEILEVAKEGLKAQGIDLKIVVFDDYVQPNMVVESGDLVANYTQHEPYLNSFNKEKGTHIITVGRIHYEPFGIYPGISKTLSEIPENASIAIPNDTTNEARALLLLQDNGLLKLRDGAGLTATIQDIVENPHNIKFAEIEAAQIARTIADFNYVVLNGNYALAAGFNVARDAIAYEKSDSQAAKTYVNIIAVKAGNENLPEVQALVKELKSDKVKKFITQKYSGAVVPFVEETKAVETPKVQEVASQGDKNQEVSQVEESK